MKGHTPAPSSNGQIRNKGRSPSSTSNGNRRTIEGKASSASQGQQRHQSPSAPTPNGHRKSTEGTASKGPRKLADVSHESQVSLDSYSPSNGDLNCNMKRPRGKNFTSVGGKAELGFLIIGAILVSMQLFQNTRIDLSDFSGANPMDLMHSFQEVISGTFRFGAQPPVVVSTNYATPVREFADLSLEDRDGSWSACLLTMDDHSTLSEWIAYHYYALKLRYLVVAVDPNSQVYPAAIFDRWRNRMKIVEWSDANFARDPRELKRQPGDENRLDRAHGNKPVAVVKHRSRQGQFYIQCARHLKLYNQSWTAFIDADEYLSINQDLVAVDDPRRLQPGHVAEYLKELIRNHDSYVQRQGACINLPRALHGTHESTDEERNKGVPDFIDAKRFDTLRYRYRATPKWESHDISKSILDVSQLDEDKDLQGDGDHDNAAHQPINGVCSKYQSTNYDAAPLHIHHFMGTLAAYLFKNDPRRSLRQYQRRGAGTDGGPDDELRPWMQGFVNMVGKTEAQYLLQDAGIIPAKPRGKTSF